MDNPPPLLLLPRALHIPSPKAALLLSLCNDEMLRFPLLLTRWSIVGSSHMIVSLLFFFSKARTLRWLRNSSVSSFSRVTLLLASPTGSLFLPFHRRATSSIFPLPPLHNKRSRLFLSCTRQVTWFFLLEYLSSTSGPPS